MGRFGAKIVHFAGYHIAQDCLFGRPDGKPEETGVF